MAFLTHLLSSSKSFVSLPKGRLRFHNRLNDPKQPPDNETKRDIGIGICFGSNEDKEKDKYAKKRMLNELWKSSIDDNVSHCCYGPVDVHDPFHLQAIIIGPSDTPFDGGIFFLSIHIPHEYPFKPPKIKFRTKVFHPNVARDGTIHIDILSNQWSPALTIEKLLLSICSFLPDPNHKQDSCNSVCDLYWNHRKRYNKIAREWTYKYAMV